jgi:hypothetical protein
MTCAHAARVEVTKLPFGRWNPDRGSGSGQAFYRRPAVLTAPFVIDHAPGKHSLAVGWALASYYWLATQVGPARASTPHMRHPDTLRLLGNREPIGEHLRLVDCRRHGEQLGGFAH